MKILTLGLLIFVGCSQPIIHRSTLIASTAALACDWADTSRMAHDSWRGHEEMNPLLGKKPTEYAVGIYFASAIALNAAIWYLIPGHAKSLIPIGVTAISAHTIIGNQDVGTGWCGM